MILLVVPRLRSARLLGFIALLLLGAALDVKLTAFFGGIGPAPSVFGGMLAQDSLGLFFQIAILVTVMLIVLSVMGYAREEVRARREFYALLLFATVGLLLVAGAQHLALVYLGLEMVSLLSYLLTGFQKREPTAVEGALKYFLFGALSTGAMLYGISLLYGLTGRLHLAGIGERFPQILISAPALAWGALLLVIVGLGFKVALVPFHMWAPDAYEGASTPVASFLSLGPKLAGFAVMVRVLFLGFSPEVSLWPVLLGLLAVLTMTVGNVVALVQTNVKRMLAYSSIAHAGTMVIGLAVATPFGLAALLYYLLAYLLMNAGAFAGVVAVGNASGGISAAASLKLSSGGVPRSGASSSGSHASRREDLGAFAGLSRRDPVLAFLVTLCFLSLAGIPPLAGFFAKMWIFGAALKAGAVGLAVVAAVNSVVALYYYFRVIKAIYLEPAPAAAPAMPRSRSLALLLGLCVLGLFAIGIWQGPWLELSAAALPAPTNAAEIPWLASAR